MDICVTRAVFDRLLAEAARAAPQECCGVLLGREHSVDVVHPAANIAAEPLRCFEIDPQALIDTHHAARGGGPEVVGYYHSHPVGPVEPSATDRARAAHDGRIWAIVGEGDVTFWRDEEVGFVPLSYSVEDR